MIDPPPPYFFNPSLTNLISILTWSPRAPAPGPTPPRCRTRCWPRVAARSGPGRGWRAASCGSSPRPPRGTRSPGCRTRRGWPSPRPAPRSRAPPQRGGSHPRPLRPGHMYSAAAWTTHKMDTGHPKLSIEHKVPWS